MIYVAGVSSLRAEADGLIDSAVIGAVKKRCGIRRADRYTGMIVAASLEAAAESVCPGKLPEDTGVIVASFLGPHNTTGAFLNELLDYPEDQVLSTAFTHSVFNAAASYAATVLGIMGPEFSITGIDDIFYEALASADSMFRTGYCRRLLLATAFDKGLLTSTFEHIGIPLPDEYAFACLLSADPAENRHGRIELAEEPAESAVPADPLKTAERIRAMSNQDLIVLRKGFTACRK